MEVDNATANSKIEAAQKAKADEEARLKAEADAKAKSEANAAAAAENARKKADFDKFVADGDKKLDSKKYDDALNAYNAALGLEIDNTTANSKIEAAKKAKADEEARIKSESDAKAKADADAANAAQMARKKEEFEKLIAKGDQGVLSKNYTDAIAQFNAALALDIDNTTANAKIAAAQKAKDEEDARLQAEANAKAKADADAANAAEIARKKVEFEKLITQGDKSLISKSFDEALNQYNAALALDIDNTSANVKIAAAQKAKADEEARIAAEADAKAKAASAAAAAEELERKKAEFEKLLKEGDRNLGSKKFVNAIENYNSALAIGYDNAAANNKIAEAVKQKEEEEARIKAMDLASRTKLFNEKLEQGNNFVNQKNYKDAILAFKEALDLNINNSLAQTKIDSTQKELDAIELARKKAKFTKLIADGDIVLSQKKYSLAIDIFTESLNLDYDNATANTKIDNAKKLEEAEKARLAAIAAKRQAELDEINRKKKEAEERERLFLEKARLAREQAKAELVARIEAQKKSLAQAERFKADRTKNLQNKIIEADQNVNSGRLDLAKKYSQGTTTEEIEESNCIIYRTIIVKGEVGDEYKKIKYNFGQIYFKKNDLDIPESIYNKETKAQ
jgi:tetratricopeptide (TPR) repeat protein